MKNEYEFLDWLKKDPGIPDFLEIHYENIYHQTRCGEDIGESRTDTIRNFNDLQTWITCNFDMIYDPSTKRNKFRKRVNGKRTINGKVLSQFVLRSFLSDIESADVFTEAIYFVNRHGDVILPPENWKDDPYGTDWYETLRKLNGINRKKDDYQVRIVYNKVEEPGEMHKGLVGLDHDYITDAHEFIKWIFMNFSYHPVKSLQPLPHNAYGYLSPKYTDKFMTLNGLEVPESRRDYRYYGIDYFEVKKTGERFYHKGGDSWNLVLKKVMRSLNEELAERFII